MIAVGRYCLREQEGRLAAVGHDPLEPLVARQSEQYSRVVRIVVDNQQDIVAFIDFLAIVGDQFLGFGHTEHRQLRLVAGSAIDPQVARSCEDPRRPRVIHRQIERERAALPRRAGQPDFAAQQRRQLTADRQTKTGAAVLARLVPASACWNASKMSRCFSGAIPIPSR